MKRLIAFTMAALLLTGCGKAAGSAPTTVTTVPATETEAQTVPETVPETTAAPETAVDLQVILDSMTLEEKLGQMMMVRFRYYSENGEKKHKVTTLEPHIKDALETYRFGGVILFSENCEDTRQTVELIDTFQNTSKLPLMLAIDQEGGGVNRFTQGSIFGGNMALAAADDLSLTRQAAAVIGSEMKALGFQIDFAPVLDVNTNPSNPVIGARSFGDDPAVAAQQGTAFLKGLAEAGIIGALKHFPGHGDTATDSHSGLPLVNKTLEELQTCELVPFQAAIDAGADIIMTAHIQYPQLETETYRSILDGRQVTLPATLSRSVITGLLRETMGYDGVITTDSMVMDAIKAHFDPLDAAKLAIHAGVDILLIPRELESDTDLEAFAQWFAQLAELVRTGEIDEEAINTAVMRILKLKQKMGLLDSVRQPVEAQMEAAEAQVGSSENRLLAWDVANQSATLLKNKSNAIEKLNMSTAALFLPYNGEEAMVEAAMAQMGEDAPDTYVYYKKTAAEFERTIVNHGTVIIVSEMSSNSFLNPESDAGWQSAFIDELIAMAHDQQRRVILISAGLPYDAARFQEAESVICVYTAPNKGYTVAAALVKLWKKEAFTGKLPVNIYYYDEQWKATKGVLYPRSVG